MAMAGYWDKASDLSVFLLIMALVEPGLADMHTWHV